ncbi:glycosyltransferase family 2 protein [Bifidobacterium moukalabense]|uniref:glycosyltransferase family 2 protein n=1 Tax=Bifidobacterium moukalabense TaxID=1333651 RepID=UPI0010F68D99|nr:glycosyltransferase family 2 protein [Bifidobacterium moukalabense]
MTLISVVVPCYNEQDSLPIFFAELTRVAANMRTRWSSLEFEAVFVDDGSSDSTLEVMKHLATSSNIIVRWLSFSRNFGKESSLYAGLEHSHGDYVATMDADMQDPPSLLPEMYEILQNGEYDNVATCRTTRKGEPPIRSWFARRFYRLINHISKTDIVDGARDFRLMKRSMVDAILKMREYNRFSKGIYGWVGFNTKWIAYKNVGRVAGQTKWSFFKLFAYALDGIVAFSTAPLVIASLIGMLLCLLAFLLIVLIVIRTLIFGDPVAGWPSMICLIMLLGGLQLLCMGILGQYLAKIYLETKNRPIYIIKEHN